MSGQYDELKFHVCRAIALATELGGASGGNAWPPAMGIKKACEYLDIGATKFRELVAEGEIPKHHLVGNKHHWRRDDLDKYLRKCYRRRDE